MSTDFIIHLKVPYFFKVPFWMTNGATGRGKVGMVQELERRGAGVACTYTGGLDFSVPVQDSEVGSCLRG